MILETLSKRRIFIVKSFSAPRGALWPVPKTLTFPGAIKAQPYRIWHPKLVDLALHLYPQEQNILWYIMVNTSSHGKGILSGFTPLWIWKSVISCVFISYLCFTALEKWLQNSLYQSWYVKCFCSFHWVLAWSLEAAWRVLFLSPYSVNKDMNTVNMALDSHRK